MTNDLSQILEDIHAAVIGGAFYRLPELAARLDIMIADADAEALRDSVRLRERLARNRDCLAAALRGMRAAQQRIDDIRKASQGLTTYDQRGVTALIGGFSVPTRRA